MKQNITKRRGAAKLSEEDSYFDTEAVNAQPVVPIGEVQEEEEITVIRPVRRRRARSNSGYRFNPTVFAVILLLTLGALSGIAAYLYNPSAETSDFAPVSTEGKVKAQTLLKTRSGEQAEARKTETAGTNLSEESQNSSPAESEGEENSRVLTAQPVKINDETDLIVYEGDDKTAEEEKAAENENEPEETNNLKKEKKEKKEKVRKDGKRQDGENSDDFVVEEVSANQPAEREKENSGEIAGN
jgi:hypothetical protein